MCVSAESQPGFSRAERRIVAGGVLLDLAVSTLFAWDVFVPELSRELRIEPGALAIVFSIGLAAFTVGVLGGGRLADRYSPRRLALVVAVGISAGLVSTAFAPSVPILAATFGVLVGGATGTGYATAVRVAGSVSTRRGLALGLVVSAYAAGTIVIAPAAAVLLHLLGHVITFAALAVISAAVVLAAAWLLPDSPPAAQATGSVSGRGRPVYSAATLRLWLVFGLGSAPGLAAFAHAGELTPGSRASGVAVVLLSIGNLAGRLVAGPFSDRIGRRPALHVTAAVLLTSSTALAVTDVYAVAASALVALGAQYGALSALTPAATADAVPATRLGATYGVVFTGWGIGGLLAPITAARAASHLGWNLAFLIFLAPAAVSWAALALPTRHARRWRN